jgi:hypothetical protein
MELARQLPHAQVFRKAHDVQPFDAAIARGTQRAFEESRADPVALPVFLDAQRGLRGVCRKMTEFRQPGALRMALIPMTMAL